MNEKPRASNKKCSLSTFEGVFFFLLCSAVGGWWGVGRPPSLFSHGVDKNALLGISKEEWFSMDEEFAIPNPLWIANPHWFVQQPMRFLFVLFFVFFPLPHTKPPLVYASKVADRRLPVCALVWQTGDSLQLISHPNSLQTIDIYTSHHGWLVILLLQRWIYCLLCLIRWLLCLCSHTASKGRSFASSFAPPWG